MKKKKKGKQEIEEMELENEPETESETEQEITEDADTSEVLEETDVAEDEPEETDTIKRTTLLSVEDAKRIKALRIGKHGMKRDWYPKMEEIKKLDTREATDVEFMFYVLTHMNAATDEEKEVQKYMIDLFPDDIMDVLWAEEDEPEEVICLNPDAGADDEEEDDDEDPDYEDDLDEDDE